MDVDGCGRGKEAKRLMGGGHSPSLGGHVGALLRSRVLPLRIGPGRRSPSFAIFSVCCLDR
jgi:hypothetical protein